MSIVFSHNVFHTQVWKDASALLNGSSAYRLAPYQSLNGLACLKFSYARRGELLNVPGLTSKIKMLQTELEKRSFETLNAILEKGVNQFCLLAGAGCEKLNLYQT